MTIKYTFLNDTGHMAPFVKEEKCETAMRYD